MDNGPELVAHAVAHWCHFSNTGAYFIDPGSPWQNGWVESFNTRRRDEFMNSHQCDALLEVQASLAD